MEHTLLAIVEEFHVYRNYKLRTFLIYKNRGKGAPNEDTNG